MNKRLVIISAIGIALISGAGVTAYQLNRPTEHQAASIAPITKVENKTEKPVEAAQPVAESAPVQTVAEPEPTPAPAPVRSFQQIILDYPNMSGNKLLVDCSNAIQAYMPQKFTDDVREKNVALVAKVFVNSCSATQSGNPRQMPRLDDVNGEGDFFVRFANHQ